MGNLFMMTAAVIAGTVTVILIPGLFSKFLLFS